MEKQDRNTSRFIDTNDGLFRRIAPDEEDIKQIFLPHVLHPRLLNLSHHSKQIGHPGQRRMYEKFRQKYHWPQMASDVAATVSNLWGCARNSLQLRKLTNPLKLVQDSEPIVSVGIDILGPLATSKGGRIFLLVVTDQFTKLTHDFPLRWIYAYKVARAFSD